QLYVVLLNTDYDIDIQRRPAQCPGFLGIGPGAGGQVQWAHEATRPGMDQRRSAQPGPWSDRAGARPAAGSAPAGARADPLLYKRRAAAEPHGAVAADGAATAVDVLHGLAAARSGAGVRGQRVLFPGADRRFSHPPLPRAQPAGHAEPA